MTAKHRIFFLARRGLRHRQAATEGVPDEVVHINNLRTGCSFSAGAINYDVLRRSFFEA